MRYFRHFGVPECRIRKLFMTVDIEKIRAAKLVDRVAWRIHHGLSDVSCIFLFVGRLIDCKAVDVLLSAFLATTNQLPDTALVIIGDGDRSSLVRDAIAANPELRLRYLGPQPQAEVFQWMKSCDAFVLPSRKEPWGLVVNEAMACGMPIIVSDAVGAGEDLVTDGVNGFVVPAEDPDRLRAAMVEMALDAARRRRMAQESDKRIKSWKLAREAEQICLGVREAAHK